MMTSSRLAPSMTISRLADGEQGWLLAGDCAALDEDPPRTEPAPSRPPLRPPRRDAVARLAWAVLVLAVGGGLVALGRQASAVVYLGFAGGSGRLVQMSDGALVPTAWRQGYDIGNMLYSTSAGGGGAGELPALGNGYLGLQFGWEWLYVSGLYSGAGAASRRARVPLTFDVRPRAPVLATALDVETGIVQQVFQFPSAVVVKRTYLHRSWQHVAVVDFVVDNTASGSPLSFELEDVYSPASEDFELHNAPQEDSLTTECIHGRTRVPEVLGGPSVSIAICRSRPPRRVEVAAHSSTTISLPTVIWTSLDPLPGPSLVEVAQAQHDLLRSLPEEELINQHIASMEELSKSGIEIEGNAEWARLVNASFWSLRAATREGREVPISPGGLTDNCYGGHSFWDAEQFVLPTLTLFHPGVAQGFLEYRYHLRDGAKELARQAGYAGLKFPWESAASGAEVSPWSRAPRAIHVSGDVSLSFWRYWQATGDRQWLSDIAWPVLLGIAQFFASSATRSSGGRWSIKGVVDLEDTSQLVDDSVYTNGVAKLALQHALEAAKILGKEAELGTDWAEIGEQLPVFFLPEGEAGVHGEFSGAAGQSSGLGVLMLQYPLEVYQLRKDEALRSRLGNDLARYPAQEVVGRHQSDEAFQSRLRNDLVHYPAREVVGSTLYWWAVATAWLVFGDERPAAAIAESLVAAVRGPFRTWAEADTTSSSDSCANSLTAAGAFLQTLWAGYAGLRLTDKELVLRSPKLPPKSSKLVLHAVAYRRSFLTVTVLEESVQVELLRAAEDAPPLEITHSTSAAWFPLEVGTELTFPALGDVRVAAAAMKCEFVIGADGANECPQGSEPLAEADCAQVPEKLPWMVANDPLVENVAFSLRGCFTMNNRVYYNTHRIGMSRSAQALYCKACGSRAERLKPRQEQ